MKRRASISPEAQPATAGEPSPAAVAVARNQPLVAMIVPGQVGISDDQRVATWLGLGTLSGWGMCRAFAGHVRGSSPIAASLWISGS